jgi:small-conductance mechanosensitive channel
LARPAISNLIAGIQLAITEPIRLEDAVIVEGEFGNIEEFTATYVIVRTWDLRRLNVPSPASSSGRSRTGRATAPSCWVRC